MIRENNYYVLGLSDTQILCYDEQRDWKASACYYFSDNPVLFKHFTAKEAWEAIQPGSELLLTIPEYAGKLKTLFWQYRETIEEMDLSYITKSFITKKEPE